MDLYNKYPGQTFSLYDYKYKLYDKSMPLSLFMSFDNKLTNNGKKLGISCYGIGCPYGLPIINEKLPKEQIGTFLRYKQMLGGSNFSIKPILSFSNQF